MTASFAAAAERVLGWAGEDRAGSRSTATGGGAASGRSATTGRRSLCGPALRDHPAVGGGRHRPAGRWAEHRDRPPARRRADDRATGGAAARTDPGPAVEPTTGPGAQAADARPTFPAEPAGGPDGYDGDVGDLPWEPPRSVIEYDRGPSASLARLLVGGAGLAWPDFAALGVPGAPTYGGGPRYRGRFSGVRLLVLADQDGHDDLVWGRAFTGEAGQRFQGLLAALGITRSYLVLRTLPVDTAGLPDGKVWALADRPDVVALLAAVADRVLDDNPVAAVVTVGPHAERIAGRFELDGQPVVALPPWSAPGARAAGGRARPPAVAGHPHRPAAHAHRVGRRAGADPPGGPPFGLPRWQGTSGDRVVRSTPPQAGPPPEPAYKVWAPRWLDTHRTP